MPLTIHIPTPDTPQKHLKSLEVWGRPSGRAAGGWIADFVGLGRCVMLCPADVHKFNPRKHHYEVWRRDLYSVARCDDCNQISHKIRTFIPQALHDVSGDFTRPRRGRWAR